MTAKEQVLKEASEWTEEQAVAALRVVHGDVDEWGNLDAWADAVSKNPFDELDRQEAEIGFSWEKHRRA